jgi:RimJ/RimL family protein N-acetyltransferase
MGLWGDAQVTALIGGPFDEQKVRERLKTECERQSQHGLQYWPIFLAKDGDHVGCCGLRPYDPSRAILEIGFHLRTKYWGQGMSTESGRAVIAHAFDRLGVAGLFAGHNPKNQVSKRVLEKLGFRYTHDEYYAPTGLQHPSYLLTADDHRRTPK